MAKNIGLRNFPVALFSSVMGFAAVTIAISNMEFSIGKTYVISLIFIIITTLLFLLNASLLLIRLVKYFNDIKKDFSHPVQVNFFGTIPISLLLLAVLYIDISENLSFIFWLLGTVFQITITLHVLVKMMWDKSIQKSHLTPVSFIPVVGNLVVPFAGIYHAGIGVNLFFFGIGIFLSIVFMTIIFYRIFFEQHLQDMLIPTLFIFLAPPSVGFISYINISFELNNFAVILYSIALFMFLLLLFQLNKILRVPFFFSWWSLLFPMGAFTVATIRMYTETGNLYFKWLIIFQMIILLLLIVYLTWRTILLFKRSTV